MVNFLADEGFTKPSLREEVLTPRLLTGSQKGGSLVDSIIEAVERDQDLFCALVKHFEGASKFYQSTAKKLTNEFARLGGVMVRPGGNPPSSYPQQPCKSSAVASEHV